MTNLRQWRLTICIFAKVPEPGQVKTRLAQAVGNTRATELARAFWDDTKLLANQAAMTIPGTRVVNVLSGDLQQANCNNMEVWPQGEGTLGERLERNLRRALEGSVSVIALGTDSPGLPLDRIIDAAKRLESHDAVIGPATDGGYYLLGLRKCPLSLLNDIEWSSPQTMNQTMARLIAFRCSHSVIEEWFDVDTHADLEQLTTLLKQHLIDAPNTQAALGLGAE